jgi:hypothetical protein
VALAVTVYTAEKGSKRAQTVQTALIVGAVCMFTLLAHLVIISQGRVQFCTPCVAFWACVAVFVLEGGRRSNTYILCVTTMSLVFTAITPLIHLPEKVYAQLLPKAALGMAKGQEIAHDLGLASTGTYVFWSHCPPCRAATLNRVISVVKQYGATIVYLSDSDQAGFIQKTLPGVPRLSKTIACYGALNVSTAWYPYVIVVKDWVVVDSWFCFPPQEDPKQ